MENELNALQGAKEKYAPEVVATGDGSHTLFIPALGEHYHSFHSSVREAYHVYIEAGLKWVFEKVQGDVKVFEVGFGTGLNALVTALTAKEEGRPLTFKSIELYPLEPQMCSVLNYCEHIDDPEAAKIFEGLHAALWNELISIHPNFSLFKFQDDFMKWTPESEAYHLILFDAFGFRAQEELWSVEVFRKCLNMLKPGGALVTYASKGLVRRNMLEAGFLVEKLPGPPGKREMVRAIKPAN